MLRIKVNAVELQAFSIGCFLMGTVHLQHLLTGYGRMRKVNYRHVKAAKYSTSTVKENKSTLGVLDTADSAPRKKSPLYTKTGDKGTSSLYNGERRSKNDMIFHQLGNQDELNAAIGIASEHCAIARNGLQPMLIEIQSRLFDLGAAVATPSNSSEAKVRYTKFSRSATLRLEEWIDRLDAELPPLTNFIIPSGGLSSTHLNLARTICRRAERSAVPLVEEDLVDAEVGRYLNRLSDFLFAAQRTAAFREKKEETLWVKAVEEDPNDTQGKGEETKGKENV